VIREEDEEAGVEIALWLGGKRGFQAGRERSVESVGCGGRQSLRRV